MHYICVLQALLEVVHDLFEEQTSVEKVIYKIMKRAQSLLKCERCTVLLKDQKDEDSEVSEKHIENTIVLEKIQN